MWRARHLPLGVAILAFLIGLIGFLVVLAGLVVIAFSFLVLSTPVHNFLSLPAIGGGILVIGLVTLIIGVIILAFAIGLWNLEQWALVLSIIVFGLLFALALFSLDIFAILWGGLVVYLIAIRKEFI